MKQALFPANLFSHRPVHNIKGVVVGLCTQIVIRAMEQDVRHEKVLVE
jgi:sporulation protein YlmC with PRC-barrel domain